jgi:altronate dehydratase
VTKERGRSLEDVARFASPDDGTAVALARLGPGDRILHSGRTFRIRHTVLVGHRFATRRIMADESLTAYGFPFGIAVGEIPCGEVLINRAVLDAVSRRGLSLELPRRPNFVDEVPEFALDRTTFRPGRALVRSPDQLEFRGYDRASRGVGTRNAVVILGVTSLASTHAQALGARACAALIPADGIDAIAAVAHTEGGVPGLANRALLVRTLAGFVVHPNVGGILLVDAPGGAVGADEILEAARGRIEAADFPPVEVIRIGGSFSSELVKGLDCLRRLLRRARAQRVACPVGGLRIALQCGGSDAFSGISANPLAGAVVHRVLQQGGGGIQGESEELVGGAQRYFVSNCRDYATAERFVNAIAGFEAWMSERGHSVEATPSAGNILRGLYNITLKALGSAAKKDPASRLEYVVDYGEPVPGPGFTYMNSPGNDLESIAGQVASGANMILFTTGSGSVTNFPFVPTLKIVSTTERYRLLREEMDINAGAVLDGTPFEDAVESAFELLRKTSSGTLTSGERSGHSQVAIWRNWPPPIWTDNARRLSVRGPAQRDAEELGGVPLRLSVARASAPPVELLPSGRGLTVDRVGLLFPTSLCAAEVAVRIARDLEAGRPAGGLIRRYVALPHTEGCGSSVGPSEALFVRMALGYLTHPLVESACLVEHGCERTHGDYFRGALSAAGFDPDAFGWASIQSNGGSRQAARIAVDWFSGLSAGVADRPVSSEFGQLRIGIATDSGTDASMRGCAARVAARLCAASATVVITEGDSLFEDGLEAFLAEDQSLEPTLAFGQRLVEPGLHVMESATDDWLENLTGLGATGVHLMLAFLGDTPRQGHPLVPVLRIGRRRSVILTADAEPKEADHPEHDRSSRCHRKDVADPSDLDVVLPGDPRSQVDRILRAVADVASRRVVPRALSEGSHGFQISRGMTGISV